MTAKTASEVIGKKATLRMDGFSIQVEILDARYVFGRDDVRVRPVAGTGEKWVSRDSVNIGA